jgi:hypothetical protein
VSQATTARCAGESEPGLVFGAWKIHAAAVVASVAAEVIGGVSVPFGIGSVVLLPMVWAMLIGALLSFYGSRAPRAIAIGSEDQSHSLGVAPIAILLFVAQLALLVGSSAPELLKARWALSLQELGHFLGTVALGMPAAVLLGLKREAVGATFSIGREPSLAIIGERYGMNSPEGRGVIAEYVAGTLVGAIFISVFAGLLASSGLFNPLALAMGAGVGSASMMAAAGSAIAAQFPGRQKEILAFAAASNLINSVLGAYFLLFISLPFANFSYRRLAALFERVRTTAVVAPVETGAFAGPGEQAPVEIRSVLGILTIVGVIAICAGNWINYKTPPQGAAAGMAIVIAIVLVGEALRRLAPFALPSVFWVSLLGMALTAPVWSGAQWVAQTTGKINVLSLATPILAYAGLSLGKDAPAFRALGWRIVLVSLCANAGTFVFATIIGEFALRAGVQ